MRIANVQLILRREVRDQLRDHRTLFVMFVLPLLMYPLLGIGAFQFAQFVREKPVRIWAVGARNLETLPPLFQNRWFAEGLFSDPQKARLLEVSFAPAEPQGPGVGGSICWDDQRRQARLLVQTGEFAAAVVFPADFAERLELFRQAIQQRPPPAEDAPPPPRLPDTSLPPRSAEPSWQIPNPEIIYNTASEKSLIAYAQLSTVLRRWTETIVEATLAASGIPSAAARPFALDVADVAEQRGLRGVAVWAKVLPVLLILWAMTGAFYPAVDLCAGEKERGTLETLLSSPARRSEIALGKLLTVILFSMATAVLNLATIVVMGWMLVGHLPQLGPPPAMAWVWLPLALPPVSALFGALCLALAAFARSAKECQYYLVPIILVTLPLVVLPLSPGFELTLGNCLVPLAGLVLLLRNFLEGNTWQALPLALPVAAVTFACCLLAVRWAVEQFNSETVLFRAGEQWSLGLWLRQAIRERQATPSAAAAAACAVLILMAGFFVGLGATAGEDFASFRRAVLITQLGVIALPALLMTALAARCPRRTLLLHWPRWRAVPAALALALAVQPAMHVVGSAIEQLYPVSEQFGQLFLRLKQIIRQEPFWQVALLAALLPAVCEELAFRGHILTGLHRGGHKWRAIVISALLFGFTHGVLQQTLAAALLGVVLGYLAVQSGSILPSMVFHAAYNLLALASLRLDGTVLDRWPILATLMSTTSEGGCRFHWQVVVAGLVAAVLLGRWFARLPGEPSTGARGPEPLLWKQPARECRMTHV
jgi:sodium transport system permease protein